MPLIEASCCGWRAAAGVLLLLLCWLWLAAVLWKACVLAGLAWLAGLVVLVGWVVCVWVPGWCLVASNWCAPGVCLPGWRYVLCWLVMIMVENP